MNYKVNFYKGKKGNSIKAGDRLIVDVPTATVLTGTLSRKSIFPGFKKVVQIAQGKNQITFLLKKKSKGRTVNFSPGKYELNVRAYDNKNRGAGWRDVFDID